EFAPDGKRLATFSGSEARVFDLTGATVATPVLVAPHIPHLYGGVVQALIPRFADGGRVLVTSASSSLVRGIDVATGKPRFEHRGRLSTTAFTVSPDGQTVWVGERRRGVDGIAVADGSLRPFTLPHAESVM